MRKLQISGYCTKTRANILSGAVSMFRKKERAEQLGMQPVHRLGTHGLEARRRQRLTAKTEWFKHSRSDWKSKLADKEKLLANTSTTQGQAQSIPSSPNTTKSNSASSNPAPQTLRGTQTLKGGWAGHRAPWPGGQGKQLQSQPPKTSQPQGERVQDPKTTTTPTPPKQVLNNNSIIEGILFVPHTPQGTLARMILTSEDQFSKLHDVPRVKIVERGGSKLMDQLGSKDPWVPTNCGRQDCFLCTSSTRKKGTTATCMQESVCYQISCDRCQAAGVSAQYCGESARTGYTRGREHLKGHVKGLESNALAKHDSVHHGGTYGDYSMKILRRHDKPLSRQIHEATVIDNNSAMIMMNSKGEFLGQRIPRVTVEMGDRQYIQDYNGSHTTLQGTTTNNKTPASNFTNTSQQQQPPIQSKIHSITNHPTLSKPTTTLTKSPQTTTHYTPPHNILNNSLTTTQPPPPPQPSPTNTTANNKSETSGSNPINIMDHEMRDLEELIQDMEDWEKEVRANHRAVGPTLTGPVKRPPPPPQPQCQKSEDSKPNPPGGRDPDPKRQKVIFGSTDIRYRDPATILKAPDSSRTNPSSRTPSRTTKKALKDPRPGPKSTQRPKKVVTRAAGRPDDAAGPEVSSLALAPTTATQGPRVPGRASTAPKAPVKVAVRTRRPIHQPLITTFWASQNKIK